MGTAVTNVFKDLTYYQLFEVAEKARWNITDIPWDQIDHSKVNDNLIELIKTIAFGELTTYSATKSFMDMFSDDPDFTQWLASVSPASFAPQVPREGLRVHLPLEDGKAPLQIQVEGQPRRAPRGTRRRRGIHEHQLPLP